MKFRTLTSLMLGTALLATAGIANATLISKTYTASSEDSGGTVTFEDTGAQELTITLDNTTCDAGGPCVLSSVITGIVFDIDADINDATVSSFVDGNNVDLTSFWTIQFDVKGSITPGNTTVDIYFASGNINGGIYNAANSNNIAGSVFPDVATLVLNVTDPASGWGGLTSIDNSVLRMQRTGTDGLGSLKLGDPGSGDTAGPGSGDTVTVPLPGTLLLMGLGLLGLRHTRRRVS